MMFRSLLMANIIFLNTCLAFAEFSKNPLEIDARIPQIVFINRTGYDVVLYIDDCTQGDPDGVHPALPCQTVDIQNNTSVGLTPQFFDPARMKIRTKLQVSLGFPFIFGKAIRTYRLMGQELSINERATKLLIELKEVLPELIVVCKITVS